MTFDAGAAAKLAEGVRILGIPAGPAEIELFSRYGDLLQLWGKKMNLTSRLKGEEIAVYHFLDSLAAFRTIAGGGGGGLGEQGGGGGFPRPASEDLYPRNAGGARRELTEEGFLLQGSGETARTPRR